MGSDDETPIRPRSVTPFDSKPKLAIVDPFEGVPRLRPPSNLGEVAAAAVASLEREPRDTDADELTPAERPFEIRVEQRLEKLETLAENHGAELGLIKVSSRSAAQHTLEIHELVKAMDRRQQVFEFENRWVPRVAWLATTLISLFALYRTYQ